MEMKEDWSLTEEEKNLAQEELSSFLQRVEREPPETQRLFLERLKLLGDHHDQMQRWLRSEEGIDCVNMLRSDIPWRLEALVFYTPSLLEVLPRLRKEIDEVLAGDKLSPNAPESFEIVQQLLLEIAALSLMRFKEALQYNTFEFMLKKEED